MYAAVSYKDRILIQLTQTAGSGTTFNKAIRLMQWLSDNTFYNGMAFRRLKDDPVSILRSSYSKGFRGALNCRHKAFAYADCLLAAGIKALPLCLLRPHKYNGEPSVGCHFMVQVFLPEQNKWIITDPSFNTYFQDGQGRLLGYFDLIECVKNDSYIIKGYNFNGDSKRCIDIYKAVFVQATMQYIGIWEDNSRKNRKADSAYYLISPEGYDLNAELKQFISGWKPLAYRAINPSDITKI